jgi:HlyD family secretion protein
MGLLEKAWTYSPGRWQQGFLLVVLLGLLGTISGCGNTSGEPTGSASSPVVAPATVQPVKQTWRSAIEQPGQIEAFEETLIYANIGGYISDVCVDMNARVKKGEALAKMSVPEMEQDLKQRAALIVQAKAELDLAGKSLLAETASLETVKALVLEARARHKRTLAALAYWDAEFQRIEKLVNRKLIDEQTRDDVRNQFKAHEADAEESKAKIDTALASQAESEARKDKAQAAVETAAARLQVALVDKDRTAAMLDYATLRAPFDGVVTVRNVHPGRLLKPATTGKDEPLFIVVRTDRVRIFVDVPEMEAGYVQAGTPAKVRIHALKDRELDAKVIRISWALNPANRTLRAEIEVPNTADEALRPGMYAFAKLFVDHAVWAVPASAIERKDDGCFFYSMMKDGKTARTQVRIGAHQGALVEVLKKNMPSAEGENSWTDLSGEETIVRDCADAVR